MQYSVPNLSTVDAATLLSIHGDIDIAGCFSDVSEGLAVSIFSLYWKRIMQLGYTGSCAPLICFASHGRWRRHVSLKNLQYSPLPDCINTQNNI